MPLDPNSIVKQLPRQRPLWLALSGGLDSMVLLHLLHGSGLLFKALHVNHQLSPNAHLWQAQCQSVCTELGVELVVKKVKVLRAGRGLEDAARQARYGAFADVLSADSVLITAHHQDDQAETLLLRLLRGAGLRGLRGILPNSTLYFSGRRIADIYRPLLSCARADLARYAREHDLCWVDDESNADTALDRNFLRHQVLPLLAQRWPGFAQRWSAAAEHLTEASELLDELAEQDLALYSPVEHKPRLGRSLGLEFLSNLSLARSKNLLRHWLAGQGLSLSRSQLAQLLAQLSHAKADAQVNVQVAGMSLRRFQHRLFCIPELGTTPKDGIELRPEQSVPFGASRITMKQAAFGLALPKSGRWQVRTRQAGERSHPVGRQHSQSLKKLLQEADLAPWLRDQVPLLCDDQVLLAVGDLWLERSAGELVPNGYLLSWEFPQNYASEIDPNCN